jgi:hypothetical protein
MFKLIKDCLFAWKYRRAVKRAVELSKLFGMKFYVIYLNGRLKVVPKKTIKELVARRRFRKGITVQDIERHALFVTH